MGHFEALGQARGTGEKNFAEAARQVEKLPMLARQSLLNNKSVSSLAINLSKPLKLDSVLIILLQREPRKIALAPYVVRRTTISSPPLRPRSASLRLFSLAP